MMIIPSTLALFGALIPLALAMVNEQPSVSSSGPTPSEIKYLPSIPTQGAAAPLASDAKYRRIHPNGRPDLCVTVQGGDIAVGAEIGLQYCYKGEDGGDDESKARAKWQLWDVTLAQAGEGGQIKIQDGKFCLSVGDDTQNASRPKLEDCVDAGDAAKKKGQHWLMTPLSIKNAKNNCDQCIDIRLDSTVYQGGTWTSQKDIQTWSCANTDQPNTNQQWNIMTPEGTLSGSAQEKRFNRREWRHRS